MCWLTSGRRRGLWGRGERRLAPGRCRDLRSRGVCCLASCVLLRDHGLAQERVRRVESCAVDRVVDRHNSSVRQQDVVSPSRDSGPRAVLLVAVLQGAVLGIDGVDVIGEAIGRGRWGGGGRGGDGIRQTIAVALGSREAERGGQRKDDCDANL